VTEGLAHWLTGSRRSVGRKEERRRDWVGRSAVGRSVGRSVGRKSDGVTGSLAHWITSEEELSSDGGTG
jgi:hypothetical protein